MEWLGESRYLHGLVAAQEALGVPDRGISQIGGHNHCDLPPSQQSVMPMSTVS
jgi:hypothetical protein